MAVSIPSNIYTLGAVQFNTQPLANLEGQLLAKREAKQKAEQDAIDKYVETANQRVNPSGMRSIDNDDYFKMYESWKKLGQSLTPNDRAARLEFERKGQELLSYIDRSKQEEKKKEPLISTLADPTKNNLVNRKRAIEAIHLHDLALNDPNRKSIDYTQSYFNPPTYDFDKEYKEVFGAFKPSTLNTIPKSTNPKTGKLKVEKGLTSDAIKQGAENYVFKVKNNPSSLDFFERLSDNMDVKEIASLAPYVHKYFPDLEVDADHPLAIAAGLAIKQAEVKTIEDETDEELAQRNALARAYAGRSIQTQPTSLEDYDIIRKRYLSDPSKIKIIGNQKVIPVSNIDSYDLDLITNQGLVTPYKDATTKEQYFIVKDNGDLEGKKGQVISWKSVAKANLDKTTEKEQKVITTQPKPTGTKKGKLY